MHCVDNQFKKEVLLPRFAYKLVLIGLCKIAEGMLSLQKSSANYILRGCLVYMCTHLFGGHG